MTAMLYLRLRLNFAGKFNNKKTSKVTFFQFERENVETYHRTLLICRKHTGSLGRFVTASLVNFYVTLFFH